MKNAKPNKTKIVCSYVQKVMHVCQVNAFRQYFNIDMVNIKEHGKAYLDHLNACIICRQYLHCKQ